MKPLYERVLVRPKLKEVKTEGGIMIPEKAVKRPNIAIVVACGDGTTNQPMIVKEGDIILCNRFAGSELTYKEEKHYMILSNEIMAVLESEDEISLEEYE